MRAGGLSDPEISSVRVSVFTIPTSTPEADGTYSWTSTTLVLVESSAAGQTGIGYTYADTSTAELIRATLAQVVVGQSAMDVSLCWQRMVRAIRNLGREGVCSMAIAAVDTALW